MTLDLSIRGAEVVDGSGAPRFRADVGVAGGRIAQIGRIRAPARRVIDADGLILAPGFIDGHTHMDAQVAWDPLGSCSCWHGVTSVVMGNCGFALAPCRPDEREWIARCLEAVEDIPTSAMMAGIDWTWESFPDYLATVEALPKAINYGAYLGQFGAAHVRYGANARFPKPRRRTTSLPCAPRSRRRSAPAQWGSRPSRATTHVTPDDTPVPSRHRRV